MPSNTTTRTPRTTASTIASARTLRLVPDQAVASNGRTDAEGRLWDALHANPHSTAADLSTAAKIGKSTAPKILTKWANDGIVTRTTGIAQGGRRAADLWAITDADTAQDTPAPVEAAEADDHDATDRAEAEPDTPAAPVTGDSDDTTVAEDDSTDPADTQPVDIGPVDAESTVTPVESAPDTADDVTGAAQAGPSVADAEAASAESAAADDDQATTRGGVDATSQKAARLPSGALRGMIEDFLGEHPGEAFGPTAIAKSLGGKSSGAVSNALDKLVDAGTAVRTSDKPRRFALAPAPQVAALVPTN